MEILLFHAFYQTDPAAFPMEFSQLAAYVWLQQAFLALFMLWFFENEIFDGILSGPLPMNWPGPPTCTSCGLPVRRPTAVPAVLRCMPILVVAVFLPEPFRLAAPRQCCGFRLVRADPGAGAVDGGGFQHAGVHLGLLHPVLPGNTPSGVRCRRSAHGWADSPALYAGGGAEGAGADPLCRHAESARCGRIPASWRGKELLWAAVLQVFWLAVLILLGRLWMKRALRRVVIQGG